MSSPASARQVYFSDVFGVSTETLDEYGAFDIALVNDLPLFIDPFLLYDSEDAKYRQLHDDIIHYLVFLRDRVLERELTAGELSHWLFFPEVRQNWLGFSKTGNHGTGLGNDFARGLCRNLATVFKNFGEETLTHDSHLEKLSLIDGGVGRDHLSDFTTNLTKLFLLEYTQSFAKKHLSPGRVHRFHVAKVTFDYETRRWRGGHFDLPLFNGDFVLLTPKEMRPVMKRGLTMGTWLRALQASVTHFPMQCFLRRSMTTSSLKSTNSRKPKSGEMRPGQRLPGTLRFSTTTSRRRKKAPPRPTR